MSRLFMWMFTAMMLMALGTFLVTKTWAAEGCFTPADMKQAVVADAKVEELSKAEDQAFHKAIEDTQGVTIPEHDQTLVVHNDEFAQTVIFLHGCGVAKSGLMPLEVFKHYSGRTES